MKRTAENGGMKKRLHLPELTTKAKILVGAAVVVFGGALVAFIIFGIINSQLSTNDIQDFTKKDTKSRKTDALTTADSAIKAGNSQKATAIYDSAIAAEPDGNRKVKLVIDQSSLFYAKGDLDQAIKIAKTGEDYGTDKYVIADWLGQLYELAKQYDNAGKYYEIAGSLADSPTNKKGYKKDHYDDKVKAMKEMASKS